MLSKNLVLRTKQVDHIIAEKEIIADIKHPFIVQMFHAFQDPKKLYLVLEFVVGGEFFTHLRQANRFPNDTAKFYAAQVVSTFDYLHTRNIIYRDLKPENLLLDRSGYLKVTDFGFAKRIDPASKTWTLCGTPEYLAPEIILNKGHGKAVDWWALGILIYEMLVGYPPFYSDDRMQLYQNILAGKIEYPSFVNRTARDLINRLLTADLTRRIGNLRGGAKDVKRHAWFRGIDWDKLNERALPAPIQPSLSGEDDLSLFDKYPDEDETEFLPIDEAEQVHFRDF
mmetsp:Transcript_9464/g.25678  ORF Transcript_9464/g.25678 Transcript_9464/m.25678 type:complete len:283 (-) Transcript_9464:161-1009(-)